MDRGRRARHKVTFILPSPGGSWRQRVLRFPISRSLPPAPHLITRHDRPRDLTCRISNVADAAVRPELFPTGAGAQDIETAVSPITLVTRHFLASFRGPSRVHTDGLASFDIETKFPSTAAIHIYVTLHSEKVPGVNDRTRRPLPSNRNASTVLVASCAGQVSACLGDMRASPRSRHRPVRRNGDILTVFPAVRGSPHAVTTPPEHVMLGSAVLGLRMPPRFGVLRR